MEPQPGLDQFLAENVKGVSVDAQAVLAHVIRPPNFDDVSPDGDFSGKLIGAAYSEYVINDPKVS